MTPNKLLAIITFVIITYNLRLDLKFNELLSQESYNIYVFIVYNMARMSCPNKMLII